MQTSWTEWLRYRDIFMCFIDFEKAFDMVRHKPLMRMLSDNGVDDKDLRLLCNLYWAQMAAVKIKKKYWIEIHRGVR